MTDTLTAAQQAALDLLVERGDEGAVSARSTSNGFVGTLAARALVSMGLATTDDSGITYCVTDAGKRGTPNVADRNITTRAIEAAVDAALGEVARQQGGIAPNVAAEARRDGIAAGRALVTRPATADDEPHDVAARRRPRSPRR